VAGLWWGFAASSVASFVIGALWFRRGGWEEAVIEEERSDGSPPVSGGSEGVESDEEPVTD
jgi:hypothetical protein